jgi:hypothetical protein
MLALLVALGPKLTGYGTGLEWMPVTSVVLGIVTLVVIIWLGSRNTV